MKEELEKQKFEKEVTYILGFITAILSTLNFLSTHDFSFLLALMSTVFSVALAYTGHKLSWVVVATAFALMFILISNGIMLPDIVAFLLN